jgi:hypothetical protein
MRKAISAPPSLRLIPSQSQPTARSPSSVGRPFVVEPGAAVDRLSPALTQQRPGDLQLRPADVVARQIRPVSLARVALVTLQQQGCDGVSVSSQENCGLCIAAAERPRRQPQLPEHPPGADRDIQVEAGEAGAEVGAGGTFGVRRRSPGMVSAACAKTIWRAAIGERSASAIPGRLRKKVSWKPTSASGESSAPVTYHHSVRNSGCAPWSRGNASRTPGVTRA